MDNVKILQQFDVINLLCQISLDEVQLATLKFETKLKKCIRMGITVFKIFIWGGIPSDIRSEMTFYGSARTSP